MNRRDLQTLTKLRLREARSLLRAGYYEGSYYLAGYAIECALKACIAKQVKRFDFPDKKFWNDSYTHDFGKLLSISGLKQHHEQECQKDKQFALNWALVSAWNVEDRYALSVSRAEAHEIYRCISTRRSGVMSWLKKSW